DRDGDLDLFLSKSSAAFFVNDGSGAFSSAEWLVPSGQSFVSAFGDQDGDGWPDLVSNAQGFYRLTWWRNDATGAAPFVEPSFALGGAPISPADIVVLDADADGDQDSLVLDASSGGIQFYGTVGGRPVETVRSLNLAPGVVVETAISGDLDRDGFPDLVTTALNEVTIWRGLGTGEFVPTGLLPFSVPGISTRIRPAELVDLDGDGALDLVVSLSSGAAASPSEVVWCPGDGQGGLGAQRLIGGPWTGQLSAPQVADIDGDAEPDVIVANSGDNRIRAWRGMGGGTFGASMTLATGNLPLEFALEDLDEDGDLDTVVLGGPWPYRLYWYPNGSSLGSGILAETPLATGFRFVDVDRNGRRDIVLRRRVVNGSDDFEFAWMRRTSLTTFDPFESLPGSFVREPQWTLADMDGDGDDDIVWARGSITNPPAPLVGVQRNNTLGLTGSAYCDAVPNSTGQTGELRALGSAQLALRSLRLAVHDLPPQRTVLFLAGRTRADFFPVPFSVGRLCIGGGIGRFVGPDQIQNSGDNGEASLSLSLAALPSPQGSLPALPFETWTFQAWHRDLVGGVPTSNFTRAVEVQFVP
ncbi:MAG: VCBS repeat-containing protein, partial [Planctomycetota bacterium]